MNFQVKSPVAMTNKGDYMDDDSKIAAKIDEMNQIKAEIDKLELMHEVVPGERIKFNTTEEILQASELHIMSDIAEMEFNLLSMRRDLDIEYKPQTLQNIIDLKKKELEEHRELQKREGVAPTSFKYQGR